MGFTQKFSWLLFICAVFLLLIGVLALIGNETIKKKNKQSTEELTRQKRALQDFRSYMSKKFDKNGDDDWKKIQEKTQNIDIQMTNMDDEVKNEHKKDQQVKQALMKMINKKLKETKIASKHRLNFYNVPGLDFRLEFASDESNPYIENLRYRCDQP